MEIAEEEEDVEQRESKRQSIIEEKDQPGEIGHVPARPSSPITGPPVTLDSNLATSPKESKFAETEQPPSFTGVPRPASPAKSFDNDLERRMSSQSARHDYYSKPRVKLGPRPSVDPTARPNTAGDTGRPVASMPAGLRFIHKASRKAKRDDDSSSVISESTEQADPSFLAPALPTHGHGALRPHTSDGRRPSTSDSISVKSLPAISKPVKPAVTQEKLRLMKALQMREKKKRASAVTETAVSEATVMNKPAVAPVSPVPPVPPVPSFHITPSPTQEAEAEEHETTAEDPRAQDVLPQPTDNESEPAIELSKADSAVDVASTAPTDHTSDHTRTDSRPPSPIGASSEVGDSTKASSISESTDETLQPPAEKPEQEEPDSQEVDEIQQPIEMSTSTIDVSDATVAEIDDAQSQNASQAPLTRADEQPDAKSAEAEAEQPADLASAESPSESSFIPTSKFASKLPSGQAVMDPMESRGEDPPNVTSGAERIDDIKADPAHVDTPERTADGASPSKWSLPISKYSTQDSSKSLASSSIPAIVTTSVENPNGQNNIANAADKMADETIAGEKERSGSPELIRTAPGLPEQDAPQENGKVSDEPQSATADDLKSTTLPSPVMAAPPQTNAPTTPRVLRTVSTPLHSPFSTTGDPPPSARSISSSSTFQQRMNLQSSTHLAPSRVPGKLGGSLASRIKAFEQMATKPPPVTSNVSISAARPSSSFFSVQRNGARDGARSPSVMERTNSIYRGRAPTPADSVDESSPEAAIKPGRERSGSVASRLSVFEGGNAPRGRPDTIQVTARIVREPGQTYPRGPGSNVDPSDYAMDLKQSPLIVDQRIETPEPAPLPSPDATPVPTPLVHAGEPRRSLQERRQSKDLKGLSNEDNRDSLHRPGQRTSLTMARDFIRESMVGKDASSPRPPSVHQTGSLLSRLSINTRRKSLTQDSALQSPASITEESEDDAKFRKDGNRASRLMRRLSSTFSPTRKQSITTTSPPLTEEHLIVDRSPAPRSMTAPATAGISAMVAYLGDVNVQFPENLLWKRRTISLDSNGFLHLVPTQGAISSRERQLKRFHMSEFKQPYSPEIEFQELPNSVCLDFKSGSGLQFAFQDRAGQLNGLQSKFSDLSQSAAGNELTVAE